MNIIKHKECPKCYHKNSSYATECEECNTDLSGIKISETEINQEKFDLGKLNDIIFPILSIISFIISIFFFYKGYDKMTNYNYSEYITSSWKNAYVGGDAYNYIINGTYSTSFFILAIGFMISGLILILIHQIRLNNKK